MAKKIIGLDISDYSIEAVLLEKKGKGYKVESYSRFRLSPDIVEDGNILNKDKLKEAINQTLFHAQPKQIKAEKVFLSVPESKVFTKVISLPDDLTEKDIKEAAKNKASEIIPEASENLVPAMKILPASNGFRDVFYSTAQLGAIKDLVEVFKQMKIEIAGITTEALSSYVGLDDKLKNKVTLMMDIGNRTTIASIFDEHGIRDTINVNIAGENIIKSLVAKTGLAYDIAEQKMRDVGMVYSVEHGETMMIVQGQLQPLLDEIKVFVNYFEQSTDKKVEQLVLIGGLSQMKGIDKYFGENLSLPVFLGVSFLGDKILPNQASSTKYINAIGLARFAFEGMEINFYNEDFKKKVVDKKEGKEEKSDIGKSEAKKIKKSEEVNEDDVKILEEEEEEEYDDTPKPFYKNKFIATILILVALASVAVITKSFWMPLISSEESKSVEIPVQEKKNVAPIENNELAPLTKVLSKNILVGIENLDNSNSFLTAELFEKAHGINIDSDLYGPEQFNIINELGPGSLVGTANPNAEQPEGTLDPVLFTEEDDAAVVELLDQALNKSEIDMNSSLNVSSAKEGYYILSSLIDKNVIAIRDNEMESDTKFSTRVVTRYNYYSIPEDKVEELLKSDLSEEEAQSMQNYQIDSRNYNFVQEKGNNIFEINAQYVYKR